MKKKGQVTIFIILGIIILFTIVAFIVFREQVTVFKPEKVVPPELEPLNSFVENCVETTARDAINIAAANGGYIRFPANIELDPGSYISTNPLFPEFKVPLWRYGGQLRIPSADFVEDELKYYIETNIEECIQGLDAFEVQFDIEKGEINARVELLERGTLVDLHYPLTITRQNQTTKIESFEMTIPLRMKTMLELATNIMEEEATDMFIETRAMDLIFLDRAIPTTDLEFTCQQRTWKVTDVRDKIKHLLRTNLPLIRVERTSFNPVPENRPYEASHYVWEVTSLKYPTTHVSFGYDESYPLELYIRPNTGGILKSNAQKGQELLSLLCMHLWHFTYDLKFPVLATIADDAAEGHERLVFNFGFQATINHNIPDKTNFAISKFDFTQHEPEEEFCNNPTLSNVLTVHTFENVSTEEYGDLTEEIIGVNVSFVCIRMKCFLGTSDWAFRGAVARVSEFVPYCVNGVLIGEKEGYKTAQMFVTTNEEKTVDLFLEPIVKKDFTVVKHYILNPDEVEELDDDESAIIKLKRKNTESSSMYPREDEFSELEFLAKWDYTYDVEIYLADDSGIIGGYRGNWTPKWTELENADEIEFHVIERPYTEDPEEQFTFISTLPEESKKVPEPQIR